MKKLFLVFTIVFLSIIAFSFQENFETSSYLKSMQKVNNNTVNFYFNQDDQEGNTENLIMNLDYKNQVKLYKIINEISKNNSDKNSFNEIVYGFISGRVVCNNNTLTRNIVIKAFKVNSNLTTVLQFNIPKFGNAWLGESSLYFIQDRLEEYNKQI